MTPDMVPNPGPEMETVYIPGNPGGQWTPEEIDSTRRRVTQMIHPDWEMKLLMGTADTRLGHFLSGFPVICSIFILIVDIIMMLNIY